MSLAAAAGAEARLPAPDRPVSSLKVHAVPAPRYRSGAGYRHALAGLQAQQRRNARQIASAKTPRAILRRRASRRRYRHLTSRRAAQVLKSVDAAAVRQPAWPKLDDIPGANRMKLLSATTARIPQPDGTQSLAVSTLPLGFQDGDGRLAPIDLDLEAVADGFATVSSPEPVLFPAQLDAPIALGNGPGAVHLSQRGARPVAGVRQDTGVLYANVDADTDLFAKPVTGGFETFDVLRSAASPETLTLDVAAGPGTSLVDDGDQTAVVGPDGALAYISGVRAWDANNVPVPVTVRRDGSSLVISVPHRSADVTYPVTVDPTTVEADSACWQYVRNHEGCQIDLWQTDYSNVYGDGNGEGWNYASGQSFDLIQAFHNWNTSYLGVGQMIRAAAAGLSFQNGWGGNFYLQAPPGTRVYMARFVNIQVDNAPDNRACAFTGIRAADGNWEAGPTYVNGCAQKTVDGGTLNAAGVNFSDTGGSYGNSAWFGAMTSEGSSAGWNVLLGGAVVLMHDDVAPRAVLHASNDGHSAITADIADDGLGLKVSQIYSPDQDWWAAGTRWTDANSACSGGVSRFVCPHLQSPSASLCGLPEGNRQIAVYAKDVSGNEFNQVIGTVPVRSDLSLSGELVDALDHDMGEVYGGAYGLHVDAAAPCGVNHIEILRNGTHFADINGTSGDVTIPTGDLRLGANSLTAKLWDGNGSVTATRDLSLKLRRPDQYDLDTPGDYDDGTSGTSAITGLDGPCSDGFACAAAVDRSAFAEPGIDKNRDMLLQSPDASINGKIVDGDGLSSHWLGLSLMKHDQLTAAQAHVPVHWTRLVVPWDTALRRNTTDFYKGLWADEYDFVRDSEQDHLLVSFEHTRDDPGTKDVDESDIRPTLTQYATAVNAFMANMPKSIRWFTAWNEPDHSSQPWRMKTAKDNGATVNTPQWGAVMAAMMYRTLNGICQPSGQPLKCHVLAGDFTDKQDNAIFWRSYFASYVSTLRLGGATGAVSAWAIHLHRETNAYLPEFTPSTVAPPDCKTTPLKAHPGDTNWLDRFLATTSSSANTPVWVTEAGSKTYIHSVNEDKGTEYTVDWRCHPELVRKHYVDLMEMMGKKSDRIKRLFYYHWSGDHTWDSGLVDPDTGAERNIYKLFDQQVHAEERIPRPTQKPEPLSSSRSASVSFGSVQPVDTECRLDDGAWVACTSPVTYDNLPDGHHVIALRSTGVIDDDLAATTTTEATTRAVAATLGSSGGSGGSSPIDDTASAFTVDTEAPETTIDTVLPTWSGTASPAIGFSGTDAVGVRSFECQLDTSAWAPCVSPQSYSGLADGEHTFRVRASDGAGNVDASPASETWKIDTVAPTTAISAAPSGWTRSSSATVAFAGDDDNHVSGYECRLDGGAWADCISPKDLSGLADGAHTFDVRTKDAAGNVDPTPASASWSSDTVDPATTITSGPVSLTPQTSAQLAFTGADAQGVSGYECRLDGGTWAPCTSPASYSGLASGSHTFDVRAGDAAGNIDATPASQTWKIDPAAAEVTTVPQITGTAQVGQTLSSDTGTWSGSGITYSRQWKRCDSSGSSCQSIPTGTAPTYKLTLADGGYRIVVTVTATTSAGGVPASSAATAAVKDYVSLVKGDAPEGYYRLGEAAGATSAVSSAGTAPAASQIGGTAGMLSFGQPGQFVGNTALSSTGEGRGLVGGYGPMMDNTFSVEAWVRTPPGWKPSVRGAIVAVSGTWGLDVLSNGHAASFNTMTGVIDSGVVVNDGVWHQIVLTVGGSSATGSTVYVDGVQRATGYWFGSSSSSSRVTIAVGGESASSGTALPDSLTGAVDEVSTYNTMLTSAQIAAHYAAATSGQPTAIAAPSIGGSPYAGQTLTAQPGGWTSGTPYLPITYSYQWVRCASTGSPCSNISGATGTTYTPTASDTGKQVSVVVRAATPASVGFAAATVTIRDYPAAVLADSPESYWKLQETGSPTTVANSGSSATAGTVSGSGYLYFGYAGAFSGSTGMLVMSSSGSIVGGVGPAMDGAFSAEAWVNAGTGSSTSTIRRAVVAKAAAWGLYVLGNGHAGSLTGGTTTVDSGVAINDGQWHLLSMVVQSGTLSLYVDGALATTTPWTLGSGTTSKVTIANSSQYGSEPLSSGVIDDVSTYDAPLTASQIARHYSASGV